MQTFSLKRTLRIITPSGEAGRKIRAGTQLSITPNVTPVPASSITSIRRPTARYIAVGIDGHEFTGYVPVAFVNFPATVPQTRVMSGAAAQHIIANLIENRGATILSVSGIGSISADIKFSVNGRWYSMEIKGQRTSTGQIAILPFAPFHKNTAHAQLDTIASVISNNQFTAMHHMMTYYKDEDSTIGFPNERNVIAKRSGKMPNLALRTDDKVCLDTLYNMVINNYQLRGEDYIGFYIHTTGETFIYHIGTDDNPLGAPSLPHPRSACINTYGGAHPNGGMRVVARMAFNHGTSEESVSKESKRST